MPCSCAGGWLTCCRLLLWWDWSRLAMERGIVGAAPFYGGATRDSAMGCQDAAAGSRRDTAGLAAAAVAAAGVVLLS